MKLVKRTHRILAVIMGVAIVATLVTQILKDGRTVAAIKAKHFQHDQPIRR